MSTHYETRMARASECVETISSFRRKDDAPETLNRRNFAAKAQRGWQEVVTCYREAMDAYCGLNERELAKELVDSLLDLVQICDEFTSSLAIQLLCTLRGSHKRLEQFAAGTNDRIRANLQTALGKKLLHQEMQFWLLRTALEFMRALSSEDPERRAVDVLLCQVLQTGAQLSSLRGNLDNAEGWYRDAARTAQDRVGDAKWASHLLDMAATIRRNREQRSRGTTSTQAAEAGVPSSPKSPEAAQTTDITEDLASLLQKGMQEQHKERFLPPPEELRAAYSSEQDKLARLLTDEQFSLDRAVIEQRAEKYRGKGLIGYVSSSFVDGQENPRGEFSIGDRFATQYVGEVAEVVGYLFGAWQEAGELEEQQINSLMQQTGFSCDWRIYEVGLSRHFQGDYISSVHTLVPQFENVARKALEAAGVDTKKLKGGVPGDVLLHDLINPTNTEVQEILGSGLFDVIYWYMVNSSSPFGYRHKVAHGWIRPSECDGCLSATTIYLTLRVLNRVQHFLLHGNT